MGGTGKFRAKEIPDLTYTVPESLSSGFFRARTEEGQGWKLGAQAESCCSHSGEVWVTWTRVVAEEVVRQSNVGYTVQLE